MRPCDPIMGSDNHRHSHCQHHYNHEAKLDLTWRARTMITPVPVLWILYIYLRIKTYTRSFLSSSPGGKYWKDSQQQAEECAADDDQMTAEDDWQLLEMLTPPLDVSAPSRRRYFSSLTHFKLAWGKNVTPLKIYIIVDIKSLSFGIKRNKRGGGLQ